VLAIAGLPFVAVTDAAATGFGAERTNSAKLVLVRGAAAPLAPARRVIGNGRWKLLLLLI
jgi:hypothetical protein